MIMYRSAIYEDRVIQRIVSNEVATQRFISKRASAMEDNRVRFVYAKSDRFVHDKSCQLVEKIKYWDFGALEKLPEDRDFCPHCKRKF